MANKMKKKRKEGRVEKEEKCMGSRSSWRNTDKGAKGGQRSREPMLFWNEISLPEICPADSEIQPERDKQNCRGRGRERKEIEWNSGTFGRGRWAVAEKKRWKKNRSTALLHFHSQERHRFARRWIPCFQAISSRKRTRRKKQTCRGTYIPFGYLSLGFRDWWLPSIQVDGIQDRKRIVDRFLPINVFTC